MEDNKMVGKTISIEPVVTSEDVLIQVSESIEVTKKIRVTVPAHYRAIAYIDQKALFRIDSCVDLNLVKEYGKELLGKKIQIAFIAQRTLAQSPWGFGNIQVNNERLKEAYRIGANGKFSIEITDCVKLIQSFPNSSFITIEQVRGKIISTIKSVGMPILGEYFSKTSTSVFEMSSLIGDFREKFMDALQNEKIFANMGIRVSTLTVDGFHANEDDLKLIRDRINA